MGDSRISSGMAYFLIVGAVLADLINWIPILNMLSALITFLIFQFYFRSKGLPTNINLITQVAEFIPIVSILPLTTVGVVAVVWMSRRSPSHGGQGDVGSDSDGEDVGRIAS